MNNGSRVGFRPILMKCSNQAREFVNDWCIDCWTLTKFGKVFRSPKRIGWWLMEKDGDDVSCHVIMHISCHVNNFHVMQPRSPMGWWLGIDRIGEEFYFPTRVTDDQWLVQMTWRCVKIGLWGVGLMVYCGIDSLEKQMWTPKGECWLSMVDGVQINDSYLTWFEMNELYLKGF